MPGGSDELPRGERRGRWRARRGIGRDGDGAARCRRARDVGSERILATTGSPPIAKPHSTRAGAPRRARAREAVCEPNPRASRTSHENAPTGVFACLRISCFRPLEKRTNTFSRQFALRASRRGHNTSALASRRTRRTASRVRFLPGAMSDPVPVSSKPAGDADEAKTSAKSPVVINALSVKMAGAIRPYLDKAAPALVMVSTGRSGEPYVVASGFSTWEKLQPYQLRDVPAPRLRARVLRRELFTLCAPSRRTAWSGSRTPAPSRSWWRRTRRRAPRPPRTTSWTRTATASPTSADRQKLVVRKLGVVASAVDPELSPTRSPRSTPV